MRDRGLRLVLARKSSFTLFFSSNISEWCLIRSIEKPLGLVSKKTVDIP